VEAIIAEASKNSKFYLREVEKDRALGKKIDQLLKLVSSTPIEVAQGSRDPQILTWTSPERPDGKECKHVSVRKGSQRSGKPNNAEESFIAEYSAKVIPSSSWHNWNLLATLPNELSTLIWMHS